MYLIGLITSCFVTIYVFFEIIDALYERKYCNHKILYFSALVTCTFLSTLVSYAKNPILNVFFSMLVLCCLSYMLYNANEKNIIVNSIIIIMYLAIIDMMIATLFSSFTLNSTYIALQEPKFFFVSGLANALVILCSNRLLIQIILRCHITKVSLVLHIYMIFLMVFEIGFLCYFLVANIDFQQNVSLLLISLGFVFIDGGILYLYKIISQNAMLEKQADLLKKQQIMTVKYYEGLQKRYEQTQKVLHDIKKHIQVITFLNNSERQLKEEYSKELIHSIDEIGWQFQCSDKIVSAIIWDKIQVCKQVDIEFEVNMQDINFDFMEKIEVTTLFVNLLDNAIEACQGTNRKQKKIILRVHRFKHYIVIKMRNTIGSLPALRAGKLKSTKSEHLGLGMIILGNLANKYCGNLNYDYSDEFFETKIILTAID